MDPGKQRYLDNTLNELFQQWFSRASLIGAAIFLLLGFLDYVITPENFGVFIRYRVLMASILLVVFFISNRYPFHKLKVQHGLAYLSVLSSAITIELMILAFGGHQSSYYAGMIVLGICVIGFIPARISFHLTLAAIIYGVYLIPIIALESVTDPRHFLTSNVFLIAALSSSLLLRYLSFKSLERELGLKYDIDRHRSSLEQEVKSQTAQLNATIVDLKNVLMQRTIAEKALQHSEERYRSLADNASDMIYRMSLPDGRYEYVSPASSSVFGYTPEDFYASPLLIRDILHPDWRDYFQKQWVKLTAGDVPPVYEYQVIHKSGETRWLHQRNTLITGRDGHPIALEGIVSDVTEQKQAETALRESEEKFRTLFEESKDVFYISTPEGRFLDINPAGIALFGYGSKEEVLSLDIARDLYVFPQDRLQFVDLVEDANYAKDYEVQMKRKNGEKLTVIITSTAVRDAEGKLTAFRGIIRDVTEQKRLEQQLLQSQKMEAIGQLAGGIAHDFNNILTAIVGYSSLLRRKLPQDDPQSLYVEHILSSTERASSLTNSLLAFSRKQVMNPKLVDLNEVVKRSGKLLLRLIGEDVELSIRIAESPLMITADSVQIEQVLMNLATNARDAMPEGGCLTIETRIAARNSTLSQMQLSVMQGKYALLSVTDTGTGMDEQTQSKIFEPFFTTKEVGKGTGLGLAMAYGIIQQHDGYITVESEPGQGTTFMIYLPLNASAPAEDSSEAPNDTTLPSGSETILLGEDDEAVRNMTITMLGEFGYTVIGAKDGEEAIGKFREHQDQVKMLILDVIMPKKNGREVYEVVKRLRPGVKVLFTSGYTADIIHTRSILEQGLHFTRKPVAMPDLLRKIREVLDQ